MTFTQLRVPAALLLAALLPLAAHAQQNMISVGIADIHLHTKSDSLSSNGPAFLTPQPAGITVRDATTLLISYTRSLDAHWDLTADLGVPPRHDVKGTGTLAPFGTVAKVKQAAPTFFVSYNFLSPESRFRPFIGIGFNYTHFYDAQSSSSGNLASGGPTKIELSDSFGLAGKIGASYRINERWSLLGSVAAADVKSDLKATTGSIERRTTIDFRPVVYTLTVGYRF